MSDHKITQAVTLVDAFEKDSDMSSREKDVLRGIVLKNGFVPEKNIWRSKYWGKNLGATHWLGKLDGLDVVLKIQGVKPDVSELVMIKKFESSNRSKIIRPPKILKAIKWSNKNEYEAIFFEYINGKKVLKEGVLQTRQNIANFFSYYKEYRQNCLPKKAWLPSPKKEKFIERGLKRLHKSSMKAYPNHPFRLASDFQLAMKASKVLSVAYQKENLEFIHGHFSFNDLFYENLGSKVVVLFSNLFWKWRYPYFDAVFAYHWFMYELNHVDGITPQLVEEQRKIWFEEIFKATWAKKTEKTIRLVNAALLERAIAGLVIDSFLVDPKKPIAKYLTDSTRDQVKKLMKLLN